jgi:hypothetical protein
MSETTAILVSAESIQIPLAHSCLVNELVGGVGILTQVTLHTLHGLLEVLAQGGLPQVRTTDEFCFAV